MKYAIDHLDELKEGAKQGRQYLHPTNPENFYGGEKLYTEKMCEAYQRDYNMSIHILRYHTYTNHKEHMHARVEPVSLAYAVKTLETFPGEENFLMCLRDNLQSISDIIKITSDIEYCVISENTQL